MTLVDQHGRARSVHRAEARPGEGGPNAPTHGACPDVSIVVLNFNGRRWLEGCLSALIAQQDVRAEILLADNASTDGSADFVASRFPSVRVVRIVANCGFAGGNNAGAREARGRFLAFINNDTEADSHWAATLASALDSQPAAGLVTSRIVYLHDPAILDSAGDGYLRAGGAFKHGHGQAASGFERAREVFGACGAAFMIRRTLFEELGGFDEDFFLVYEDVDLSFRAQLRGHRCHYVPDAVVRHAGSATMGTVSRTSVFYGQRNLEWAYLKNTPMPYLLRSLPAHVLYSLAGGASLMAGGLGSTWFSAKWAAFRGLRGLWRKRRAVLQQPPGDFARVWGLMERSWLRLKWREKQFDRELRRNGS